MSKNSPSYSKIDRNGKIDIYRFLFCIAILFFHANKYYLNDLSLDGDTRLVFFAHGAIGVEFFFITSGFFMAKSVYKKMEKNQISPDLGLETSHFLWGKIKSILSLHLITFVTSIASYFWLQNYSIMQMVKCTLSSLPSLFLIQMTGFLEASPNHVEWYISVMLLSMLFLYPLLRKNYSLFVHVIAPLLGLGILGWMSYTYASITGTRVWTGLIFKSTLRGIADISLGTTAFEITRLLNTTTISKKLQRLLTIAEIILTLCIFAFINLSLPNTYEFTCGFAILLLVIIAFRDQSSGNNKLFNNKVSVFLGKYSLPVYLSQVTCINLIKRINPDLPQSGKACLFVISTLLFALCIMQIGEWLKKIMFHPQKHAS